MGSRKDVNICSVSLLAVTNNSGYQVHIISIITLIIFEIYQTTLERLCLFPRSLMMNTSFSKVC